MKIYTENQVSNYAHSVGEPGIGVEAKRVAAYGEEFNQSAEAYEKQAKGIYSSAIKNQWNDAVNSLMENPEVANNPQTLETEIRKLNDKMSSEIVDDDVKVDFISNSILNSKAYINHARNNQIKLQNERAKSSAFNAIYGGMNNAGVAVLNILSGGGNSDDIAALMNSRSDIASQINAVKPDGTYLFTNEQRLKMSDDFDKNVIKAFKAAYDNASDDQKELFYKKVMGDNLYVVQSDKGPININAKEVLTPTMMKDVKNYVRDAYYKNLAEKEKEYKYNKLVRVADYMKEPTKTGLDQLKNEFPDLDDKTLDKIEGAYKESPNYMAETQPEALSMAVDKINQIATKETYLEDGSPDFNKQLELFIEANEFINKQSTGKDAQLGYDDVQTLREKAAKAMLDEEERAIRLEISKYNDEFLSMIKFAHPDAIDGYGIAFAEKTDRYNQPLVRMTAKNTIYLAEKALSDKTLSREDRIKKAKDIYNAGKQMLLYMKYPEIDGKKEGDKVTIDGVTYEIVGFDNNDVQLRVSK